MPPLFYRQGLTRIAHGKTREELYTATVDRTRALRKAGYSVIEKWECDDIKTNEKAQKSRQNRTHMRFSMTLSRFTTARREKRRPIL